MGTQPSRLVLSVACLYFAGSSAFAVDWKALKPQGYVSDFAGVIDARNCSAGVIDAQYSANIEKATSAPMAFVTIPTLQGEPIEDVANDLFLPRKKTGVRSEEAE